MKNSFFRLPENMSPQARSAFLLATVLAVAHIAAMPYYLYLGSITKFYQFLTLAGISLLLGLLLAVSAVLSWRERPTQGIILALGSMTVAYPLFAPTVAGLGLVLGIAMMIIGPMSAFKVLPRRLSFAMAVLTIVSGLISLLLDIFGSATRPVLPGLVIQFLAGSVVILTIFVIVRQRIFISGYLANISFAWKMGLMVAVLFLGTLGITVTAYLGMQSLRYQLSNIYDFMLIPIVAINNADTALATTQFRLQQLHHADETTASERAKALEDIQKNETLAADVIARYDTEWVTTTSPEFTQALQEAGKLDLQQQEIAALESFHSSFDVYKATAAKYLATIQAGSPDESLASDTIKKLESARANLQTLIKVNNQFADFSNAEAQAAFRQALLYGCIVLSIGLFFGLFVSYLIVVSITRRLSDLTNSAAAIQEGNLDQTVAVTGHDEVALLGTTFNSMISQLKSLFGTLESRVLERTHGLELAGEVGRSVSQVRALDVMLKDAAEIIRSKFDLYYVQVYLTDPSQTNLILQSGTGTVGAELVGRGHRLPLNMASINGRAALEKRSVVITDTTTSATFKPNLLLPDTRSETAVPLLIGEKVVGVLDLQSRQANALNQDSLTGFEALAGQLAIAIQNATFFAETEQARAEIESQARRQARTNWIDYMDAIHKPEETGFVFEQNKIMPMAQGEQPQPATQNALTAPIAITGEALGNLVVEMEGGSPISRTPELVNIVARQVAQQIENLRLLESAERYRHEAEQAARLQTLEGWQKYMASRSADTLGYLYDTKEVQPHSNGYDEDVFALPLKARDETVGKLGVKGLTQEDQNSVELVNAVAERLSAHIENLRLFEETRLGQIELDKRARELASVAEISSVSSREFDVQKMLESVVHLTQRKFGLYHCHVFLYNEQTNILKIAACGWKEGDEHEGTHGTAAIPLDQEQSLVARAARTRKAVVVNDVHNEPGWLPNPLLPDTASELAVPLLIGDRLLGVLDVQSDRLNAFTDEDANIQTTLASQVATALQNAYSFTQAQSALAQSEQLFDASRNLTQATDLQQLVSTAVNTLKIPAINRAILVSFNYSGAGSIESLDVIANWWNGTGYQATTVGTHYPLEVIRAMTLFVSPTPVFFNDAFHDERVDATTMQLVQRLNLRAVAVLPLHTSAGQIGALVLEAEGPHNFTIEETRLFTAIAPQIATVVDNRRQFERAQKQAEREAMLNMINQKIQSATSIEAVLQIAARELGHALGAPMTIAQLSMKDRSS